MDSQSLKIFKAVADAGSVSRAAEALNYVQSNVTTRLRQLEDGVGTALFYRQPRGMALTPAGKVLFDYAVRILNLLDEAQRAVADSAGGPGCLMLGAMETAAAVRLPPVLAAFHRRYPEVRLTLVGGNSEGLIREVLARNLDVAFVGGGSGIDHPELVVQEAFAEELVLIGGPRPDDSRRRVLLCFRQGCFYRARAEQVLRELGLVPFEIMEFGALEAILGCVAAGMGVTVMPMATVERSAWRDQLSIQALPSVLATMPTLLIRRRDALLTRALVDFQAMVAGNGAL